MIDVNAINAVSEYILRNFVDLEINPKKDKVRKRKVIDKIDVFNVFRVITNKKISSYFDVSYLSGRESEIADLIDEGEIDKFIKEVNPFFKKPYNQNKYDFYVKYYFISKLVLEQLNAIIEKRKIPQYFKIYDVFNQTYLDNQSFDISTAKRDDAIFFSLEEAKEKMQYYANAYQFLEINLEIRIDSINEINEIISSETFCF